jgi:hypothetical protein
MYLSDLRNDYEVQRGRSILLGPSGDEHATKAATVMANLRQLGTLEPGKSPSHGLVTGFSSLCRLPEISVVTADHGHRFCAILSKFFSSLVL